MPTLSFSESELIPYKVFYDKANLALGDSAKAKVLSLFSNEVAHDAYFESMGFAFHFTIGFSEEVQSTIHGLTSSLFPGGPHRSSGYLRYNATNPGVEGGGGVAMTSESASTERLVRSIQRLCVHYPLDTVTIAMHIRHFSLESRSNPTLDQELDSRFTSRLKAVLNEQFVGLRCRLLLASDRKASVLRLRSSATALGCDVYTVPRGDLNVADNVTDCFVKGEWNPYCLEQGPWRSGTLQVADLLLLSHAQYFIGTGDSTYSHLIAYLLSLRRASCHRNWMSSPVEFIPNRQGWSNISFHLLFSNPLIVSCPPDAVKRLSQSGR